MKCHECIYKRTIPGNCHIKCVSPPTKDIWTNPLSEIISLYGKRIANNIPIDRKKFGIEIDNHGFHSGWANWPFNFDPIWINKCKMFERDR